MELVAEPQMGTNAACQLEIPSIQDACPPAFQPREQMMEEGMKENLGGNDDSSKNSTKEETPRSATSLFVLYECSSSTEETAESERQQVRESTQELEPREAIDLDLGSVSNGEVSSDSALSSSSVPSASNTPIVTMACIVCGTTIEMPSYTALTRKCFMKCSGCNSPTETNAKNWLDIILTALYNLEVLHKRKYFHCKNEICTFIDRHWNDICPERARTPTWGNTIMSQISTHPELFVSHQRGSGYWALKRKHFRSKKAEAKGHSYPFEDSKLAGRMQFSSDHVRRPGSTNSHSSDRRCCKIGIQQDHRGYLLLEARGSGLSSYIDSHVDIRCRILDLSRGL